MRSCILSLNYNGNIIPKLELTVGVNVQVVQQIWSVSKTLIENRSVVTCRLVQCIIHYPALQPL